MGADLNRYEVPWTAEVYDYQVGEDIGDLAFWESLAAEAEGEVLELACGTGRVTLPLARAGATITGLDLSPAMLEVALHKLAQESADVAARVSLVEGDMSRFDLGRRFGLIIVPFNSFQMLRTRTDQRGCLERCARHLRPGGRLVIDLFHANIAPFSHGTAEHGPVEFPGPGGESVRWWASTEWDPAAQHLRAHWRYERTGSDGETIISRHVMELRYFFRFEMEWMLEACGYRIAALYGDYQQTPMQADSPQMIFVAQRTG